MPKLKKCTRQTHQGNPLLPLTEFHKCSSTEDGLAVICRACKRIQGKEYRAKIKKDPERNRAFLDSRKRERERGGKIRQLFYAASGRAFTKGLDFNIEKEDIVIPEICPVLGIPIAAGRGRKGDSTSGPGNRDSSPSVDRIDNSKGYVKGNVRVISWRANYLKNTATLDELVLLGEDAKKYLKYNEH